MQKQTYPISLPQFTSGIDVGRAFGPEGHRPEQTRSFLTLKFMNCGECCRGKVASNSRQNNAMSLNSFITLGRSGLRVSPLCLGTMTFGEDRGGGFGCIEVMGCGTVQFGTTPGVFSVTVIDVSGSVAASNSLHSRYSSTAPIEPLAIGLASSRL